MLHPKWNRFYLMSRNTARKCGLPKQPSSEWNTEVVMMTVMSSALNITVSYNLSGMYISRPHFLSPSACLLKVRCSPFTLGRVSSLDDKSQTRSFSLIPYDCIFNNSVAFFNKWLGELRKIYSYAEKSVPVALAVSAGVKSLCVSERERERHRTNEC